MTCESPRQRNNHQRKFDKLNFVKMKKFSSKDTIIYYWLLYVYVKMSSVRCCKKEEPPSRTATFSPAPNLSKILPLSSIVMLQFIPQDSTHSYRLLTNPI